MMASPLLKFAQELENYTGRLMLILPKFIDDGKMHLNKILI